MSRHFSPAEHAVKGYHDDTAIHTLAEILGLHFYEGSQCNDDGYFDQCDCAERVQDVLAGIWADGHRTGLREPVSGHWNPYRPPATAEGSET